MSDKENFSSDVSEYQLVFKMFDKESTGEINIKSVYKLLKEFERREENESWNPDEPFKEEETKEPPPKKVI